MMSDRIVASLGLVAVCCLLAAGVGGVGSATAAEENVAAKKNAGKATPVDRAAAAEKDVTQGALRIVADDGTVIECPLKHTDVEADISGFLARVKVTQTFVNPTKEKIEAVYVFPLPNQSAVDDMTMVIGKRRIVGVIKRRDAARRIYEEAVARGQTAALLEQERPNIFTQSVGNIGPGQTVNIEISYVDVLNYDQGSYEFHFPMVVGPRYNPQKSPGQPEVADAAKINPPVLKPKERTSHDISLTVNLDAGVPIQNLANANHKVHTIEHDGSKARVRLLQEDSIPNKDFVLRYDVVGEKPEMAMLAHTGDYGDGGRAGDGYFMLMIQPKEDERLKKSPPREIVFLVDVSGSMSGQPTATTRAAMEEMLDLCRKQDTVQVVTFAGQAHKLFEKPVPVNEENIKKAVSFARSFRGSGGTRMLEGVKMAIDQPLEEKRLRIVVMLTDGYIGNEAQIIEHVGKNCGDQIRFWAMGVGSSPNMFLIDGVAKQGGGMGKRLGLNDDIKSTCTEVITRIQRAQLAKVKIDWGELQVSETFPARLPELWAGRPVIVYGRYKEGGDSKITVSGNVEGEPASWPLTVSMPARSDQHDVLAKVWARKKIEDVMHLSYYGGSPAVEEEVTALALRYRLMSQYTSFVAVDEKDAGTLDEPARPPRRMTVPVPLPEGTRYEGFFGGEVDEFAKEEGEVRALGDRLAKIQLSLDQKSVDLTIAGKADTDFSRSFGRPSLASPAPMSELRRLPQLTQTRHGFGLMPAKPQSGEGRGRNAWGAANGVVPGRMLQQRRGIAVRLNKRVDGPQQLNESLASARRKLSDGEAKDSEALEEGQEVVARASLQLNAERAGELAKQAQAAAKSAGEASEKGDLEKARRLAMKAYFLDVAAANFGQSNAQTAMQSLEMIARLHDRQVQEWIEHEPRLKTRLDLVLRDRTLAEAVSAIAKASGLKIQLVEGSERDAASLQGESDVHINFLDLRGATVAQAMDWLLSGAQLAWWASEDGLTVSSERRRQGETSWVYDVSLIALPTEKELGKEADAQKKLAAARKLFDQFLKVVTQELPESEDAAIVWFSPGELLISGDRETHRAAGKLFAALADGSSKLKGEAAKLAEATRSRAANREAAAKQRLAAHHRHQNAARHHHYGWQLLADAAGGKLDLEALTQLQIAWRDEATAELLKGDSSQLGLRSLWMVCAAARALPDEAELQRLARDARRQAAATADAAVRRLTSEPKDGDALVATLFASLALSDNATVRDRSVAALKNADTTNSGLSDARIIALALLGERGAVDREALARIAKSGSAGNELTVLLALACHRVGGDLWQDFRIAADELLGKQPLRGEAVVIISRLPRGFL